MADSLPSIGDLEVVSVPEFRDARGALFPLEVQNIVPFSVMRLFWITDVPAGTTRGAHAHKAAAQFYICCRGKVDVEVWDGKHRASFALSVGETIHIPPMVFSTEIFSAPDNVLLVASDRPYDNSDYLHTPDAYLRYLAELQNHQLFQ